MSHGGLIVNKKPAFLFDCGRRGLGSDFGDFDAPSVRGSATSLAAAAVVAPRVGELLNQLRAAFREAGPAGLCDHEGVQRTGISGNSYRPRRVRLAELGEIFATGESRSTPAGRRAQVWRWAGAP